MAYRAGIAMGHLIGSLNKPSSLPYGDNTSVAYYTLRALEY